MTTKLDLDNEVWVFGPDDMCIGPLRDGCKRCMLGWLDELFWCNDFYEEFDVAISWAAHKLDIPYPTSAWHKTIVTPQQAADTMNLATCRLGYVHGNPMRNHPALKETT